MGAGVSKSCRKDRSLRSATAERAAEVAERCLVVVCVVLIVGVVYP